MFTFLSNLAQKFQNFLGIKPSAENLFKNPADEIEKSSSVFSGESIVTKLSPNAKPCQNDKKLIDLVDVLTGNSSEKVIIEEVRLNRDTNNREKLERKCFIGKILAGDDTIPHQWNDWIKATNIENPLVDLCFKNNITSEEAISALNSISPDSCPKKRLNDNDIFYYSPSEDNEELKKNFLGEVDKARQVKSSLNYGPF